MTQAERYGGFRNGMEYNVGDGSGADKYFKKLWSKPPGPGVVVVRLTPNPPVKRRHSTQKRGR